MVRVFLLRPEERAEIKDYIKNRPPIMSDTLRQARMRAGWIDFDQLRQDLDLMEQFARLKIRKGRNRIVKAGFTIKKETPEEETN